MSNILSLCLSPVWCLLPFFTPRKFASLQRSLHNFFGPLYLIVHHKKAEEMAKSEEIGFT
jgi:hypothetical protein